MEAIRGNEMKIIKNVVLIVLLQFVMVSCSLEFTSTDFLGKRILNYPLWIDINNSYDKGLCDSLILGYSSWMDWQTEGKELHQFVNKIGRFDSESFNGKFKLILVCQRIVIQFDDRDETKVDLFCYIGSFTAYTVDEYWQEKFIKIPILDENVFEFDCHLRKYHNKTFEDNISEFNKAHIRFEKKGETNGYNYILNVAGKEIIRTKICFSEN